MSTLGIFGSTNFQPEELQLQSFAGTIFRKFPGGQAPLLGFTSMTKKGSLAVPLHTWQIDQQEFPHTATTAQNAACPAGTAQTFLVQDATQFTEGVVLDVTTTNERLRVVSVVGPFEMVCIRGYGRIPPQVIPAGTELWRIGTSFEESSLRPLARTSSTRRDLTNVTQIFRDAWAISGTAAAMKLSKFGENQLQKNKRDAATQHAVDMEMSMIFGQRYEGVQKGQAVRTMDGIISLMRQYAPESVHNAPSVVTYRMLEDMLDPIFDFNTDATNMNDRVLFCGKVGRKIINDLGRYYGVIQTNMGQTAFGHRFTEFTTTRGHYKVMEHPMFNTRPDWSRMILALDLSTLSTLNLEGRDTYHRSFNKGVNAGEDKGDVDAGIDAEGGSFLTEHTIELGLPEANAVIFGLADAACEPCPTLPTTYQATFTVSRPCVDGAVAGGTVITLNIVGTKAGQVYNIITPTGIAVIAADGSGNGSANYTLPGYVDNPMQGVDVWGDVNVHSFGVVASGTTTNISFRAVSATACVSNPCNDPNVINSGDGCLPVCVTTNNV